MAKITTTINFEQGEATASIQPCGFVFLDSLKFNLNEDAETILQLVSDHENVLAALKKHLTDDV